MSTRQFCDRCDKVMPRGPAGDVQFKDPEQMTHLYDLCAQCADDLTEWLTVYTAEPLGG